MNLSARTQKFPTSQPIIARPVRERVRLPLQVTHHVFVGTRRTECICTDINEHGIGVNIAHPLSVGEIVKVELELPRDRFEVSARVIYRNQHHCGLYFVDLNPEQRNKLRAILKERVAGLKNFLE
jgi:hypothetical protein